jgi:hypothetical protein
MTKDELVEKADLAFDRNEYQAARDLYRQAANLSEPTPSLLCNSGMAVELDHAVFLQSLTSQFPDSLDCGLAEVLWLIKLQAAGRAVVCCNDLLSRHASNSPGPLDVRFQRFCASLGNRQYYRLILEDCSVIWDLAGKMENPTSTRSAMLKHLAGVSDPSIGSVLQLLAQQSWVTAAVQLFLEKKVEELQSLQDLEGNLR